MQEFKVGQRVYVVGHAKGRKFVRLEGRSGTVIRSIQVRDGSADVFVDLEAKGAATRSREWCWRSELKVE